MEEDARRSGVNSPHQIDVLVTSGVDALFIECKRYIGREVTKGDVAESVYNFMDICARATEWKWHLAIIAPREIPLAARMPVLNPHAIPTVKNLAGGSLTSSTHFVYFKPPDAPSQPAPFFVLDEKKSTIGLPDRMESVEVVELWERLHAGGRSVSERVNAGLALLARDRALLARNENASRVLVHGLMHLGRVQEALYVRRMIGTDRRNSTSAIEDLMMKFQLDQQRYPRRTGAGNRAIDALGKMVGKVLSVRDEVGIRSFVGPVIARRENREDGLALLDGVERCLGGLETEDAPYYEVLRLTRKAQFARAASERDELLGQARSIQAALPVWNRAMAAALIQATEARPRSLYGLEIPFDVEEWLPPAKAAQSTSF